MRAYEYRHIVAFEETNVMGNVYYVNHLRWQGRCRELFLRENAPAVLAELAQDLSLVTARCSCEYLAELSAFDEIVVRMRLGGLLQSRILLQFEYWRPTPDGEELIARGEQEVVCMRREGSRLVPASVPVSLRQVLQGYMESKISGPLLT